MAAIQIEPAAFPHNSLPGISTNSIYAGRYKDRTPDIRSAGKLTASGATANQCMSPEKRPDSPEVVRRFRATIRPDASKTRIFYGKAYDPQLQWSKDMIHGLSTQPSLRARDLVNPSPKSLFEQRLIDKKDSLYATHQRAPLGRSHDQSFGFPRGLDPSKISFGIKTEKDGTAGELVNPDKTRAEVCVEEEQGRELYRKTHFDYRVGEQCNRNYYSTNYSQHANFGIPTPHENNGRLVRETLKWQHDTQSQKTTPVISKRLDDFRERTQPQLGKVHDPIKDTMTVPSDHTFGILFKPDEYGVGDLMHGRNPQNYLRGKDRLRGIIAAMRQHLKKANYHNFDSLLSAFRHYDTNGSGSIDINELRDVCQQFSLPVDAELLEQLMKQCNANMDGQIDYLEFANFLNWKDKLPSGIPSRLAQSAPSSLQSMVNPEDMDPRGMQTREVTPRHIQKQVDRSVGDHRTSASMINAVVGGVSTRDYRNYGIPTVRTDLPAPRIKRVSDRTNYGDESDAYGLINPSIYSSHGVFEKDFLIPREKAELKAIFTNIGVHMDYDTFDKLYEIAASRHPRGHVSVEGFKNILDECQAHNIQKMGDQIIY